jgi:hypothetical protein
MICGTEEAACCPAAGLSGRNKATAAASEMAKRELRIVVSSAS